MIQINTDKQIDVNSSICGKWYKVFLKNDFFGIEKPVVGVVLNFSSIGSTVLFNDEKDELYIFKHRDIEMMMPLNTRRQNNVNTNLITNIAYEGETEKDLQDKFNRAYVGNNIVQVYVPVKYKKTFELLIAKGKVNTSVAEISTYCGSPVLFEPEF